MTSCHEVRYCALAFEKHASNCAYVKYRTFICICGWHLEQYIIVETRWKTFGNIGTLFYVNYPQAFPVASLNL
jgi:hypothetical protein